MLTKAYLGVGLAVLLYYGSMSMLGWEWFTPSRQVVARGAHSAKSGYRSHRTYGYWGYRGGK